ncbi:MAG: DUF5667 domain-containing protein [Patescibacteria group bacterium]|jgi:hypothetical protein
MEDLEKQLSRLPKSELSKTADFKIKFKIRLFIFTKNLQKFGQTFFHPHSLMTKVSLVALLVFVVLGSTVVYAVNNDNITPGHSFYPLKKTIENVEQQLSLTKTSQVDTLGKFSERRLKEALNLSQEDSKGHTTDENAVVSNNIKQTISEAVDNVDSAIKTSQKIVNTKNAKKAKESIKKKNKDIMQYLDNIGNIAQENQDEEVMDKIREAKKAIDKYNEQLDEDDGDKEETIKPVNKNNKENRSESGQDRINSNNESNYKNNSSESEQRD